MHWLGSIAGKSFIVICIVNLCSLCVAAEGVKTLFDFDAGFNVESVEKRVASEARLEPSSARAADQPANSRPLMLCSAEPAFGSRRDFLLAFRQPWPRASRWAGSTASTGWASSSS